MNGEIECDYARYCLGEREGDAVRRGQIAGCTLFTVMPYLEWSRSQEYASGEAWTFDFRNGWRTSYQLDIGHTNRALCVRRPGG
jgi:hypothetical protein